MVTRESPEGAKALETRGVGHTSYLYRARRRTRMPTAGETGAPRVEHYKYCTVLQREGKNK